MWSIFNNSYRPVSCNGAIYFGIVFLFHLIASEGPQPYPDWECACERRINPPTRGQVGEIEY